MKIILVDDEIGVRDQGKIFLERFDPNFEVTSVESAEEALDILSEENFHVVVSDYQMPNLNGLEFLRILREDREDGIPFIMFTGKGREEVAMEALNLGAQRYVKKGGSPKSQYWILGDAIHQEVEHSRVKETLKERNKRYESFFKTTKDCAFITTKDGSWVEFNDAALDLFGYEDPEELMEVKIPDLYNDPERRKEVTSLIEDKGFVRDVPADLVRKDGSIIHTHITSVVMKDEIGEVTGYQGTIRDLTEKKQYEEELKRSKDELEGILNNMNDAVLIHSPEGNFIFVNDAAINRLGYSREELMKMSPKDIDSTPFSERVEERVDRIEKEKRLTFDSIHVAKDGEEIPVEINSSLIDLRGDKVILSVVRDVRKRDGYEKELEETTRKLTELHNHSLKITSAKTFDDIYRYALDASKNVLDFEDSTFMSVEDNKIVVKCTTSSNVEEGSRHSLYDTLAGRAFLEGRTIVVDDVEKYDGKTSPSSDHYRSTITVPIGERGIFQVLSDEVSFFSEFDKEMAELLALQVNTSIERMEREEKVRKRKEEYQAFVESTNVGVGVNDANRDIIFVNETLSNMLGYEEDELVGKNLSVLIDQNEYKNMEQRTKDRMKGEKESYECKVKKKDGSYIYANVWASPLRDQEDRYIGDLGVIVNITDRKEAEFELTRNQKAIEASIDGIGILDKDERFVYLNDAHVEIYGYNSVEELIGKSWKILYSGKELSRFEEDIIPIFKNEGYWRGEAVGTKKDGSEFDQEVTLTSLEEGGLICIVRDITERKIFEKKMRETDMAFESSITGIALTDVDRRLTRVNQTLLDMWGYESEDEVVGRDAIMFFKDQDKNLQAFEGFFSEGWMDEEMIGIRKDGSEFFVKITANLIEDDDGEPIGIFASLMDITDRKNFEEREEFLHSLLRHDLKNKIQVAVGYMQLLEEIKLSKEQSDWVKKSEDSLLESLDLISKVKELRAVNEGLDKVETKLHEVIERSIKQQGSLAEMSGIEILYDRKTNKVVGGPLLEELFNNIIENALIHSKCGVVQISSRCDTDNVTVSIEDDGCGIPDDDKNQIFDKGFKGPDSKGSGLGMYLVDRILKGYEGAIKVRDSELGGTRFDIRLQKA